MPKGSNIFLCSAVTMVTLLFFSFSITQISPRLQKKIDAAIISTFEVEHFELEHIPITSAINEATPVELGSTNLFKINSNNQLIGYLYLGEAPSMKRKFDYTILFNTDLTIKKSKVLIYREDYGQQIGSQRWLKQFIGLSEKDKPTYGENIDAVSGATISASSMTNAVADVLHSISILKEKKLIL